ncbi:cytochrome P450 93A3-like protein [Tanacetum coccineum]
MVEFHASLPLFFVCLISTVLIWARFFKPKNVKSRHPPTPFGLPIIGHLHLLRPIPHQALYKLSLKHGPIFRVFMGSVPSIVACSPEIAKEFLRTNEKAFSNRTPNPASDYLVSGSGEGSKDFVFAPHGPYWTMLKWETNNMMRMVIGKRFTDGECKEGDVSDLVSDMSELLGTFNPSYYIPLFKNIDFNGYAKKLKNLRDGLDTLIAKAIDEHEEAKKQNETREVKDLLDILLEIAHDESMEIKLTRVNIKGLILLTIVLIPFQNMFLAGTDTSASTLEWLMAELINHPNVMQKAKEEIDQVVGKIRLVQESDIPNLPYLQAIVKEGFRLYPATPTDSKNITTRLHGGRDPGHWENPLDFNPERFVDNMLDVRGQHFHFLPFGSGRRMCPAISLALLVVHTTLGGMIQCFDWKAGKDGNLTSVDMEPKLGLTLMKASPLVCLPMARLDPLPI